MGITAKNKNGEQTNNFQLVPYNLDMAIIEELKSKYMDIAILPNDKDAYAMVMGGLRECREIRVEGDEWHRERKALIVKAAKHYDKEKRRVHDLINPIENHLKEVRKKEDDRLASIEKARVDAIQMKIRKLESMDMSLSNLTASELQKRIDLLEGTEITEVEYAELLGQAMASVHNTLINVKTALENRVRLDNEIAEQQLEKERLEKVRLEQETAQAKIDAANRVAAENLAKNEARMAAEQAKIDKEKRKIQEEKDRIAKEKREAEIREEERIKTEKAIAEKAEYEAKEKAEKEETERKEKDRKKALRPDKEKLVIFADKVFKFVKSKDVPSNIEDEIAENLLLNFLDVIEIETEKFKKEAEDL